MEGGGDGGVVKKRRVEAVVSPPPDADSDGEGKQNGVAVKDGKSKYVSFYQKKFLQHFGRLPRLPGKYYSRHLAGHYKIVRQT